MKKLINLLIIVATFNCFGQKKIKITKSPVAWSYQITPKTSLPDGLKNYAIHVDTQLDPMSFWGEIDWRLQHAAMERLKKERLLQLAKEDTINKWIDSHMTMPYPAYARTNPADFTITLATDKFSVDSINTNIDYEDQESLLGEINVSANLRIETSEGDELINVDIPYYIDDVDGPTTSLRLRHFVVNPSFKLKLKMTKKPEKRQKLLKKRIKKFEADILEYFIVEAGHIIKDHYQNQKVDAYSAVFGIKNKGFEALNDAVDIAQTAIHSFSAFSRKKRKTFEEVKPDLEYAKDHFIDKLTRTTDPKVQNVLNANLSTILLILDDIDGAKLHLQKIPEFHELNSKTIWDGSFTYYLKGLDEAISTKEKYQNRALLQSQAPTIHKSKTNTFSP